MSIFEISIVFLIIIFIALMLSAIKVLRSIEAQLVFLKKTTMNFEKIVFDDNFEIKAELRHMNSKNVYDEDFLRKVRNFTITRE